MLRFHRFHMPAAAERPASSIFPSLCGCCAPECTDSVSPLSLVTLADAMRPLDVSSYRATSGPSHHVTTDFPESRATGPLTPFLFHMITVSRLCLSFVLAGLRHTYVTRTRYLAGSRYALRPLVYPDFFSRRFSLRPVLYPVRFPSFTYPTGRYFCLSPLRPLRPFVLVFPLLVYILGWRWDDPHLQSTLQPP